MRWRKSKHYSASKRFEESTRKSQLQNSVRSSFSTHLNAFIRQILLYLCTGSRSLVRLTLTFCTVIRTEKNMLKIIALHKRKAIIFQSYHLVYCHSWLNKLFNICQAGRLRNSSLLHISLISQYFLELYYKFTKLLSKRIRKMG